jgi:hypothetical protein
LTGLASPAPGDGERLPFFAFGVIDEDADAPDEAALDVGVPACGADDTDGADEDAASGKASAVSGAAWASPPPEDSLPSSARLRPPAARARPAVARRMRPRRLRCALRVRRLLPRGRAESSTCAASGSPADSCAASASA